MRVQLTRICLIPLFVLWLCEVMGQSQTKQEPLKTDPVDVLSPKGINVGQPGSPIFKYGGNVKMRHRGVLLFCDQALYQVNDNQVAAIGHVLIVQGDTIIIKADTLVYEGVTRQATLRGRVTFQDRRIILNAAQLDYRLATGIAHYATKGRLVDNRNVLTSREGYYDTRTRQIELLHTVRLVSPENTLTAEALIYNTTSRLAILVEPTRITGKDGVDVVQRGQYDTQEGAFQPSEITAALTLASPADSLDHTPTLRSILPEGSLALLTAVDKPLVAGQVGTAAHVRTPLPGKTALPKTSVKPTAYLTLAAPDKKKQSLSEPLARPDTTHTTPGTVVENLKSTGEAKAITRSSLVVKRTPVKHEEPASAAATLVPTGKPDEQVTLAAPGAVQAVPEKPAGLVASVPTDSVAAPTKPLEMPVRLTGVFFRKPVGTTPIKLQAIPVIGQKVIALPPPKQADSTYLAAASATVLPKPTMAVTATSTIKKSLPAASPSVKSAIPTETRAATELTKTPSAPIMATTTTSPAVLPEPSIRQVANPQAGSGATFRAAVVVPSKRIAPHKRPLPDPEESDLERELNKTKHPN